MIDVVSADKFTTYLELLQRRPIDSLEKRRRGFSGIPAELIHYADTVDYEMKSYFHFTLKLALARRADLADFTSDLCSIHISVRGYTNMMAVTWHEHQTKSREFIYEEILAFDFKGMT